MTNRKIGYFLVDANNLQGIAYRNTKANIRVFTENDKNKAWLHTTDKIHNFNT